MQGNLLPILGITLSVTVAAGSVLAIPAVLPDAEPSTLNSMDISSLWTARPIKIDPSKQHFERLPARPVPQQETADALPVLDGIVTSAVSSGMIWSAPAGSDDYDQEPAGLPTDSVDMARIAWCSERYRSYRASDNTFQPYTGARRPCEPPVTMAVQELITEAKPRPGNLPQHASNTVENADTQDAHLQWCFSRYRSFDPADNTYRAYSGEIRSCVSPYI
ncbi:MAG TPA: BA14K family protein [Pararhizobium sp.]|uniref:BA14K family protein n=1 Tax=Pararhizobium sp. TaxID=1977563 RepID=UPI002C23560C|nr:BA14K family protein [Pararhizobium sp.]HTO34124.1 BA14K family protein [Pararhizobium sp.]